MLPSYGHFGLDILSTTWQPLRVGRQAQAAAVGAGEEAKDPRAEEGRGAQPRLLPDLLLLQEQMYVNNRCIGKSTHTQAWK